MALSRAVINSLITDYAGGDPENIDFIVTTNSDIIKFEWYKVLGKGVRFVDTDLGTGEYKTGFEFYENLPLSADNSDLVNWEVKKIITFIGVDAIDRISFKADKNNPPSWAWTPPTP